MRPLPPRSGSPVSVSLRTFGWTVCLAAAFAPTAAGADVAGDESHADPIAALLEQSCLDCHSAAAPEAGFDLESADPANLEADAAFWEKAVRKLQTRQMPPADALRPDEAALADALHLLETRLDAAAERRPQPGRTATFRRLTRYEYGNAIRDLLGVEVDAARWLPKDEASHGFDNVTVGDLSPTRMERYVSAAREISRLALGRPGLGPDGRTVRLRPDLTQENHLPGLPLGTRGGVLIPHHFPRDGQYEVRVRLMRDRNEQVEGLSGTHSLDLLLDRRPIRRFIVTPPGRKNGEGWAAGSHAEVDRHLVQRLRVDAGPHDVAVAFLKESSSLEETARQPHAAHFNYYRHPRLTPAVYEVTITGPFEASETGDSPSRERIVTCSPEPGEDGEACVRTILAPLLRGAYRRPVEEADFAKPLALYRAGAAGAADDGDRFGAGLELALSGVLVNPHFLFRVEADPPDAASGAVYQLDDLSLASRLSFFLWSSLPDEELLAVAERGALSEPAELDRQVRRMLADDRAAALVENFAGQWLHLRNLDAVTPDMRAFPDFDDNLRQAFRRETELLFAEVMRENRPATDLLSSDHTYLNERLAKHYGVPGVFGSRFRRVDLPADSARGGILRHGSLLTVTSYATRTSPVLRGTWVLDNLLGTPPPPPPDDIPALEDNSVAAGLSVRERLAAHRDHAACAPCHDLIDPLGFAFENYDAVGRWRTLEDELPVDPSGGFPGGAELTGVPDLERELLARPEPFLTTLAEKLLIYALGRGLDHRDAPAVRRIVRDAAEQDYRFAALVAAVAKSIPFQYRTAP